VPLATVLAGVGLGLVWPIDAGWLPGAPLRYVLGGAIILASVLGLGAPAVRLMRRSGQHENPWKPTSEILVRGPYRFTRNPMYLQMVIACMGFAVLLRNVWILILTPVCAWVLDRFVILREEAYLERKFGEGYRAYKRRVRRWL
jgi:protein-S-isoprenylcysteine O-methyltransferase Ste14